MNDDYLWDRTGEPDADVQELEAVLGTLRYQPRPLVLPADLPTASRRTFFPALAIAATILLAVVAAGLWLGLGRQQVSRPGQIGQMTPPATGDTRKSVPKVTNGKDGEPPAQSRDIVAGRDLRSRKDRGSQNAVRRNPMSRLDGLTPAQRLAGEAAKEQVMLALRVASLKLNLAQRKTQVSPTTNSIRNQHKLG